VVFFVKIKQLNRSKSLFLEFYYMYIKFPFKTIVIILEYFHIISENLLLFIDMQMKLSLLLTTMYIDDFSIQDLF